MNSISWKAVVLGWWLALLMAPAVAAGERPLRRWSLDESGPEVTWADGEGLIQQVRCPDSVRRVAGVREGAREFAGEPLVVAGSGDLGLSNAVTVLGWARVQSRGGEGTIVSQWSAEGREGSFWLGMTNGVAAFTVVIEGVVVPVVGNAELVEKRWHLVAGVYDGEWVRLYVDGLLEGEVRAEGPVRPVPAPVVIGGCATDPQKGWRGALDEVRVYGRGLLEEELTELYRADTDGDGVRDVDRANEQEAPPASAPVEEPGRSSRRDSDRGWGQFAARWRLWWERLGEVAAGWMPVAQAEPPCTAVGWWRFEEGSGTVASNAADATHHGVVSNGAVWVSGIVGQALRLDGSNDWVAVSNTAALDPAIKTVSFWMRARKWNGALVGNITGANPTGSGFLVASTSDQKLRFQAYDGAGNGRLIYSEPLPRDAWHGVTLVVSGSNLVGYVNGAVAGTTTCVGYSNAVASLWRMGWLPGGFTYSAVDLDEVRVDPCAWGPEAVQEWFQIDSDGDGWTNRREMYFGTNPHSAASQPTAAAVEWEAWWPLDETNGTWAADASGHWRDGTLYNQPIWTNGVVGGCLQFAPGQQVTVPNSVGLNLTNNFTVAVWIRPFQNGDGPPTFSQFFTKGDSYWNGWGLRYGADRRILFQLTGRNTNSLWSARAVPTNQWTHVAVTVSNAVVTLWLDGVADATTVFHGPTENNTSKLYLGGLSVTKVLVGQLDEPLVISRPLTAAEVAALHGVDSDGDGLPNVAEVNTHGTNPHQLDSDGDALPDGWEVQYGLDPLDATGVNGADGDYDGDGLTNLAEFLAGTDPTDPDITPPSITPALQPVANAFGWHNTNVVVSFVATDTESGVAFVTGDVTLSTETNDAKVVGIAIDNAGNSITNSVFVSIDLTPPELTLDPGTGDTFDNSHPLLIVEYRDQPSAVGAQPAGLNLETLSVTLDGVSITNLFHRFARRAIATITNLNAGTHTWSASISDYAGNVTSTTVVFTATGTVNPNAPVLTNLNVGDSVLMPDVPEIWVQGKVSGQLSVVSASVNGEEAIPMNRREDDFGYLLPLEYGENVIVLVADDRAGNLSSKLVRVERSDRFRAAITSPAFGTFAEGQSNVVTGFVSAKIDVGQPTETNVVSVTINGGPVTLHWEQMDEDGNVPFTRDEPLSPDAQPIRGVITWADGRTTEMPPSYQEDYEVVARRSETRRVVENDEAGGAWRWGEGGNCWPQWVLGSVAEVIRTNEYSQPDPAGWITVVTAGWKYRESAHGCVFDPETDEGAWDGWTNGCPSMWGWPQASCSETNLVPKRSLTFGHHRPYTYAQHLSGSEWLWPWTETTDASLRFRAPLHYRTNQLVVFTFEGMEYGRPAGAPQDLGLVKFIFNGKTNEAVAVSNEVQSVSYLITVDGGKEYTLTPNSFLWPTTSTNWVEQYVDLYNPFYDYTAWHTNTYHTLTFTGFHNAEIWGSECVVNPQWHHLLPQEFRSFFAQIADTATGNPVNIDEAKWGVVLDMNEHRFGHNIIGEGGKKWNKEWEDWIQPYLDSGTTPSYAQLQTKLTAMKNDAVFAKYIAKGKAAAHSHSVWLAHGDEVQDFIRAWAVEKHATILTRVPGKQRLVGKIVKRGGLVVGFAFLAIDVSAANNSEEVFAALWRNEPILGQWYTLGEEIGNAVGTEQIWYSLISFWNWLQPNPELKWYRERMIDRYGEHFRDGENLTPGSIYVSP